MEQLNNIIEDYKKYLSNNATQRELADCEYRMRNVLVIEKPEWKGERANLWFANNFGGSQYSYTLKQRLFYAGKDASSLWDRVENGMTLRTAVKILEIARKTALEKGQNLCDTIAEGLSEYDNRDGNTIITNGKVIKRAAPYSNKKINVDEIPNDVRNLKHSIRSLLGSYADQALSDIDPFQAKKAKEELFDWVSDGIDTFLRRTYRLKSNQKEETLYTKIGRSRFSDALEIMGLQPSEFNFGKPLNLRKVKKAYRERIRSLHPDANNGSHEKQKEFEAVNEALKILETYSDQVGAEL